MTPSSQGWVPHPAQRGLLTSAAAGGRTVNCAAVYLLTGDLKGRRLLDLLRAELATRDVLRLRGIDAADGMRWFEGSVPRLETEFINRVGEPGLTGDTPSDGLARELQEFIDAPFDLRDGPIGRVRLVRLAGDRWVLAESYHHALLDGRSLAMMHHAVGVRWRGGDTARPAPYLALLSGRRREADESDLAFWKDAFDGFATPDRGQETKDAGPDPMVQHAVVLDAGRAARLRAVARSQRATPSGLLFAAHAHAAARYRGTGDIAVRVPLDARGPGSLDTVGQLTQYVPIRLRQQWDLPVARAAAHATRVLLVTRDHLGVDAADLDAAGAPVDPANPGISTFVTEADDVSWALPGIRAERIELASTEQTAGPVTVVRTGQDGSIRITLRARERRFGASVADLAAAVEEFLDLAERAPHTPLGSDQLLPSAARAVVAGTATPRRGYAYRAWEPDVTARLVGLGDRTVLDEPDGEATGAAALLARTAALAKDLAGAGAAGRAVLVATRSVVTRVAAFLSTSRVGACYVPVEASAARTLPEISARTGAVAVVDDDGVRPIRPAPAPVDPLGGTGSAAAGYVIFTSGSTGVPKGVVVSRAAFANLIRGEAERFGLDEMSRVLLIAPPTTDPWLCHVAAALMAGATLVPVDLRGSRSLGDQLDHGRVTHAFLPAALVRTLEPDQGAKLQLLASGGEPCRVDDVRGFLLRTVPPRVVNIYGPTEATVTATVAEIGIAAGDPLPIGAPIRGLGARVVFDGAVSAPPGVPGELVLTGVGVATGYLPGPGVDGERFDRDPFDPVQPRYRTGDRAHLRADGQFVVTGRIDREIKISGTRVQPAAVESLARASGLCADAYAHGARRHGGVDLTLTLFVTGCTDPGRLRAELARALPPAAVPARIEVLAAIPRHDSGKIDTARLPSERVMVAPVAGVAAAGPLADAWAEAVGARPIPEADFFGAGGDSLAVLRLVRTARAAGLPLSPSDVYRTPVFADLAALVPTGATAPVVNGVVPFGPAQHWFAALGLPRPRAWHQRGVVDLAGRADRGRLRSALARLLETTPMLRARTDLTARQFTIGAPPDLAFVVADEGNLAAAMSAASDTIDPESGRMLAAVLVRRPSGDAVVLQAHHLVVDVWSWLVLADRLRAALLDPDGPSEPDDGFARYAGGLTTQLHVGAFDLDAEAWRTVLAGGHVSEFTRRPHTTYRVVRSVPAPRPSRVARPATFPGLVLAGLGAALRDLSDHRATVIDVERNARTAVPDLDLSSSVGWVAVHHPLVVPHAPLSVAAIAALEQDLADAPDSGAGYGMARWSGRASLGDAVGRFALDIAPDDLTATGQPDRQIPTAGPPLRDPQNWLPYAASLRVRPGPRSIELALEADPQQLPPAQAEALLDRWGAALTTPPAPGAGPPRDRTGAFRRTRVPLGAMQQLMLAFEGRGGGVYQPQQLLLISPLPDPAGAVAALGQVLASLPGLRTRLESDPREPAQAWRQTWFGPPVDPDRTQSMPLRPGGESAARAWLAARPVPAGAGPAVHFAAFATADGIVLAMSARHAVLDGVSNAVLIEVLDEFAANWRLGRQVRPDHWAGAHRGDVAAVTKHVAAERAVVGPIGHRGRPHVAPAGPARLAWAELPAARSRDLTKWAAVHGVDLRAALCGLALDAGARINGTTLGLVVGNGRDPDLPGSARALGLFWYFRPIPLDGSVLELARRVFAAAGAPLSEVRAAAAHWPAWPVDAASVNVLRARPPAAAPGKVRTLTRRDLSHTDHQFEITIGADDHVEIRYTSIAADPPSMAVVMDRLTSSCNALLG